MEQRPLHWSERAKMYPASPSAGTGQSPKPVKPGRDKQPRQRSPKSGSSRKGLIITLVIIFVAAAAAAAVFFWYLPSRDSDDSDPGAAARDLVRGSMVVIENAYADTNTFDPQTMTPTVLSTLAPDTTFLPLDDTSAATSPTASADRDAVNYAGTEDSYAVGALAADGTSYGVIVERGTTGEVTYYLNGQQVETWAQADATDTSDATPGVTESTEQTTQTTDAVTGPIAAASDMEAMVLVRNAMTTVESAYAEVGTFEPSQLTAGLLQQMEPSTTFVIRDSDQAATAPVSSATEDTLDFYGTATTYALGAISESGNTFGVIVDIGASGRTTTLYINGQVDDWGTQLGTPMEGSATP